MGNRFVGRPPTDPEAGLSGLALAKHGLRDLGLSYGHLKGRTDPLLSPKWSPPAA